MKKLLMIIAGALLLQGCLFTSINTVGDEIKAKRFALLYPFKTGGFEYDPATGLVKMHQYSTDGGGENLERIFEAGVKAGMATATKGVMP